MGAREHQNAFDPFLSRRPRHEDLYRPHRYQSDYSKYKLKYSHFCTACIHNSV